MSCICRVFTLFKYLYENKIVILLYIKLKLLGLLTNWNTSKFKSSFILTKENIFSF